MRRRYFIYSLILFSFVAVGSWFCRSLGWYTSYWYADVILHFVSGITFALCWFGMAKQCTSNSWILFLGAVGFAVFGSVLWEFWEYAGWHITPTHARFYIPELGDTLSDIFCGLSGAVFISSILSMRQE